MTDEIPLSIILDENHLKFLKSNAVETEVNGFAHYHLIGAPFSGCYKRREKKQHDKPKIHIKIQRKFKVPAPDEPFDWELVSGYSAEELQHAVDVRSTLEGVALALETERRERLSKQYYDAMWKMRCMWCSSGNWGYWGINERLWANCHCRRCEQDFYWHPYFGMNSYCGMVAVRPDPEIEEQLLRGGIEPNPGPEKECTKRDSKRRQPSGNTRNERLSNSHPDIYKDIAARAAKIQLTKRQEAQFKQQMRALDKPRLQYQFSIPVHITFESFSAMFQKFIDSLPAEMQEILKWADLGASIWILFFDKQIPAKYLACRVIYSILGIETLAVATFSALVLQVLRLIGFVDSTPVMNAYSNASPLAVVMTLVLTFLFRRQPGKDRVNAAIANLKDLPLASSGVQMLVSCFEGGVKYFKSLVVPEETIDSAIDHIKQRVKFYLSEEGSKAIDLNLRAFEELAVLQQKALEIASLFSIHSVERIGFAPIQHQLNQLYRRAQLTPISGHAHRKRPAVIQVYGTAGIGKSRMVNLISADAISTILKLDGYKDEELSERVKNFEKYVYMSPTGLKFEQNFNSHFSRIYVCDDANQVNNSVNTDEIPFPIKLIALNNTHDHMMPVAEVDQKKDARFNAALIIATDNDPDPDLKIINCPSAYYRRIDFSYKCTLKPEFAKKVVAGDEEILVVDESKVDITKPNTHIYNFYERNSKQNCTYRQLVIKLIQKLRDIHTQHTSSIQMFKEYAEEGLKQMLAEERKEQLLASEQTETPLFETPIVRGGYDFSKISDEQLQQLEADTVEALEIPQFDRPSTSQQKPKLECAMDEIPKLQSKFTFYYNKSRDDIITQEHHTRADQTWTFWFIKLWISIVTFRFARKIKKFFTKPTKNSKNLMLFATSISIFVAAYFAYRTFNNKREKKKRFDKQPLMDSGYNAGDAKKHKEKPKDKPSSPYRARRMHGSSTREVQRIDNLAKFSNSPNLEVACQASFAVQKILCSNAYLAQLIYTDSNGEKVGRLLRGFFIKGSSFIVNRHFVTTTTEEWRGAVINLYNVFETKLNIPTSRVTVMELEEDDETGHYDVVCIDFGTQVQTHADFTRMFSGGAFMKEEQMINLERRKCSVFTVMLNTQFDSKLSCPLSITGKTAWYAEIQHTFIRAVKKEVLEATGPNNESVFTYKTLEYEMQGIEGYCGSVVVMNDPEYQGRIVGIHMAGYTYNDTSYAQSLSLEMIKSFLPELQVSMNKNLTIAPNTLLDDSKFNIVKTLDHQVRTPVKSKIFKTRVHNKVFQTRKKPAHLGMYKGEHVANKAMLKYTGPSVGVSEEKEQLFSSILHYKFSATRKIREFSREIAIRGIEGNHFVFPINRSSSAGYPLNIETKKRGKTEYCGEGENFITDHPRVVELMTQYEEAVERNDRPECFFLTTSKDEIRLIEKVDEGKTRCFAAAPLYFSIFIRQKYLDLVANMMENRIQNSSLVGINPYGIEWDAAAATLTSMASAKSHQFLAGDFTNFDGSLNRDLLWCIYAFMEENYDRKDDKLSKALWRDLVESQQLFGNAVVHITRGHPSGHPMTAILNTLYNAGLTYLALYDVLEEIGTVESFSIQANLWNHYSPLFYGDDNCIAFSKEFCSVVNPTLLPVAMERLGHIYTTDTKDGAEFEYRTMAEISILKRKFLYDKGVWYAPLELASILEPLNWDKIATHEYEQKRQQLEINVRSAIRELALHPSATFEEWRNKLLVMSREESLTLTPDCHYTQETLRKLIKRGDGQVFLQNDLGEILPKILPLHTSSVSEDEMLGIGQNETAAVSDKPKSNTYGIRIYEGGHHGGSPTEDSQTNPLLQFRPTLQVKIRTASQSQINMTGNTTTNVLSSHDQTLAPVGDIPFVDKAKDENLSGQQIISFSTDLTPEVESIPAPQDLDNDILALIQETRDHSIHDILCREYAVVDGVIPVGGSVNDILLNIDPLSLLLAQPNVAAKLSKFAFIRANIKIRLEFTAPPTIGGSLMANIFPDLYSSAINNRLLSRLQRSQAPRQEILLSTVKTLYLDLPWISPFYARSLPTGTGSIGRLVLSRITTSNTSDATYKVYVQCDAKSIKVEYPTLSGIATTQEQFDIQMKKAQEEFVALSKKLQWTVIKQKTWNHLSNDEREIVKSKRIQIDDAWYKIENIFEGREGNMLFFSGTQLEEILAGKILTIKPQDFDLNENDLEGIPKTPAELPRLQMKSSKTRVHTQEPVQQEKHGKISGMLDKGSKLATIASGIPVIGSAASMIAPVLSIGSKIAGLFGFSKTIAEKPLRAVRWKPADSHLPNEGVLPSHAFGLTGSTLVETRSGQFGSEMDEMAVEYIERSTAIIGEFRVATSTPVNRVVAAIPCSIMQYETSGSDIFMTHQMWLASAATNWLATLNFDFDFTGNGFHFGKLRFSFNAQDPGIYDVGDTIPLDALNTLKSKVVAFGDDMPNNSISIEPVATSAMKYVPSTRDGNGSASFTNFGANRRLEQCNMGMLYVTVEVPLRATTTIVAQYADFYITFSAENLQLSNPAVHLPFCPRLQSKEEKPHLQVLQSSIGTKFNKYSRSERMGVKSSSMLVSNAMGTDGLDSIKLSMGDKVHSIKNLLNAYTVFCPTLAVQQNQAAMIFPYCVRATELQTVAQRFRHNDFYDYFAVGYGFYKGSMNIRLAKIDSSLPLGEVFLQDPTNNLVNPTFSPNLKVSQNAGFALASVTQAPRSGTRSIPVFAEECSPDFHIPYYSGFHCNRVSTDNTTSFVEGRLDQRLVIKPFTNQTYRVYRAVGDDFHFGTLTALP